MSTTRADGDDEYAVPNTPYVVAIEGVPGIGKSTVLPIVRKKLEKLHFGDNKMATCDVWLEPVGRWQSKLAAMITDDDDDCIIAARNIPLQLQVLSDIISRHLDLYKSTAQFALVERSAENSLLVFCAHHPCFPLFREILSQSQRIGGGKRYKHVDHHIVLVAADDLLPVIQRRLSNRMMSGDAMYTTEYLRILNERHKQATVVGQRVILHANESPEAVATRLAAAVTEAYANRVR